MKIYNYQLDGWMKSNSIAKVGYILAFGPEDGPVDATAEMVVKAWTQLGDYDIIKLDFREVKDDFSQCLAELSSMSLFGQRKLVIVSAVGATLNKGALEALEKMGYGGKVIFKGLDLKASSSFRKFVEGSKNGLSIGCYNEDTKQIAVFIRQHLQESNVAFDAEVVEVLALMLPANKLLIRSELQKLMTYCMNRTIQIEDVTDSVCGGNELALDELCVAVVTGKKKEIIALMHKAQQQDESFILILRVLQRYVMKVLNIRAWMQQGLDVQSAVSKLSPPVFFKQRDALIRVCSTVDMQNILALNADLVKLERDCKLLGMDTHMIITNFLIQR
jgi:DNA polymerase-3 subunit delta